MVGSVDRLGSSGRNRFDVDVVCKRKAEGGGERVSVLMNRASRSRWWVGDGRHLKAGRSDYSGESLRRGPYFVHYREKRDGGDSGLVNEQSESFK